MNALLIALLAASVAPLVVGTLRGALAALSLQGFLLGWIVWREGDLSHAGAWIALVDLLVVRGVLAPLMLRSAPSPRAVIRPSLLVWAIAFALILLSFDLAANLVPAGGEARTLIAVAASGVSMGFLLLATQAAPAAQMIAAIEIEDAIALVELRGPHPAPALQLAQLALVALTVILFRWYLATLDEAPSAGMEPTAL